MTRATTDGERTETVLVVDDEELTLDLYEAWLDDGYDVRTATDGEAALDRLDGSVSAVLLDRNMPGMDGRATLDAIRDRGTDHRVAVVSAVEPDLDVLGFEFDEYVVKPTDREEVQGVVERLLALDAADGPLGEYVALASKRAVLEEYVPDADREASAEYDAFRRRVEAARARVEERPVDATGDGRLAFGRFDPIT